MDNRKVLIDAILRLLALADAEQLRLVYIAALNLIYV